MGAVHGALAWTAYWSAETFFSGVAPRFLPAGYSHTPLASWHLTVGAFAAYLLLGLILGVLLGFLQFLLLVQRKIAWRPGHWFLPACSALSVTLLLGAYWPRPFPFADVGLAGLLLLAVVAALQILAASSDSWALRLSPAANAWSASFIAVGSVWLAYDVLWKHSPGFRWLGIALFLVAVPVVGYPGQQDWQASAPLQFPRPLGCATIATASPSSSLPIGNLWCSLDRARKSCIHPRSCPTPAGRHSVRHQRNRYLATRITLATRAPSRVDAASPVRKYGCLQSCNRQNRFIKLRASRHRPQ